MKPLAARVPRPLRAPWQSLGTPAGRLPVSVLFGRRALRHGGVPGLERRDDPVGDLDVRAVWRRVSGCAVLFARAVDSCCGNRARPAQFIQQTPQPQDGAGAFNSGGSIMMKKAPSARCRCGSSRSSPRPSAARSPSCSPEQAAPPGRTRAGQDRDEPAPARPGGGLRLRKWKLCKNRPARTIALQPASVDTRRKVAKRAGSDTPRLNRGDHATFRWPPLVQMLSKITEIVSEPGALINVAISGKVGSGADGGLPTTPAHSLADLVTVDCHFWFSSAKLNLHMSVFFYPVCPCG